MGLYLLNISVDVADPNPEHIPEDLSFNDQESIVELVVEKVLGFEDAIQEYDDHDTEDHNKQKNIKIDLLVHVFKADKFTPNQIDKRKKLYSDCVARLTQGFNEIDSPPPKV
ncbi:hypothetical protein ACFS5J_03240 [Flavobacterium chuncheonense]|uniref:Uncharacterized protein n=1 Tax=Flavobacterium chuncheonense TaxID=2026653 RepID=A0ABW5YKT9_9FLAO